MTTQTTAPRRQAYRPGVMSAGQRIDWITEIPGHYEGGYGNGPWVAAVRFAHSGVIWSDGDRPRTWWVLPDDDPQNPVLVRQAGKKDSPWPYESLYSTPGLQPDWRAMIRRAEHVRQRGIYPVVDRSWMTDSNDVETVNHGRGWQSYRRVRIEEKRIIWHADPACPDAAGKPRPDGTGREVGLRPDGCDWIWTPDLAAGALAGATHPRSSLPFCDRCVLLIKPAL